MTPTAAAIFGPTAVGKTDLSIRLAQYLGGQIISVDSMQVYRYLNIGTAKPSQDELSAVRHHLIDIIDPDQKYSAADFRDSAETLIMQLSQSGIMPLLVGGTGLYYNALFRGLIDIPPVSQDIRNQLHTLYNEKGQSYLYGMLLEHDPNYAAKIHANDKQRTNRALEVYLGTGRTFSSYLATDNHKQDIRYIRIGLNTDRNILYDRINRRVDMMMSMGLTDEVRNVLAMGYAPDCPGMKGIGYRETIQYISGLCTEEEMIYNIKQNTRHYAKRQLTWFRSIDNVQWFDVNDKDLICKVREYIESKQHE